MTLLPCPFCGEVPELPDVEDCLVYAEIECEKCFQAKCSIQILTVLTDRERFSDDNITYQGGYLIKFRERAILKAIAAWNRRADQDTLNKAVKLIDELLEKEPLYALGEWPSLRDALSILANEGAIHE